MDSYVLTGPQGSSVGLGSWLLADPGPDFDFAAINQPAYVENPYIEGAALAYERSAARKFRFPLLLASSGSYTGGLPGLTSLLRQIARPGGYVDLQPENVASADVLRFDVIDGRLDQDYGIPLNRVARTKATLQLDVKPFGYLPTWITLASVASLGLGGLAIPAASIMGDVSGQVRLTIGFADPSAYPAGSWITDYAAWSLGARPSFSAFWPAASLGFHPSAAVSSLMGDVYAPGSQAMWVSGSYLKSWWPAAVATIPAALEPAYRGRFRAFAYAALTASQNGGVALLIDAESGGMRGQAMASYISGGSVAPGVATGTPGVFGAQPSPAYQLCDLGELALPLTGSGLSQDVRLRIWAASQTAADLKIGGIYLLPVDGNSGVMPRGLAQPSILTPSVGRLHLDSALGRALVAQPTGNPATDPYPMAEAYTHYRGDMPAATPSVVQFDLLTGARKVASGATAPVVRGSAAYASVSVSYRPRFAFLKNL